MKCTEWLKDSIIPYSMKCTEWLKDSIIPYSMKCTEWLKDSIIPYSTAGGTSVGEREEKARERYWAFVT